MEKNIRVSEENFLDFPIGEFPFDPDHSATGEYHTISENGYHGRWLDRVCNYTWAGAGPTWIITESDGRHYMEQMRIAKNNPHRMFPTLETGDFLWQNTRTQAVIRRMSTKGMCGICFAMRDTIDTLVFSLEGKTRAVLTYRYKEELRILAEAEFASGVDDDYLLCADIDGEHVTCYIDGRKVLETSSPVAARGGRSGITADCPTRFTDFSVGLSSEELIKLQARRQEKQEREDCEMAKHPAMKLWKKIDLKDFGTSRQIRFGHLTGTPEWHIVLAQMQRRVHGDAYGFISCLTAIDLDGNILWQHGEPSEHTEVLGKVSADMPFQVYDIDGDGKDEVICGWNFEIRILDGATGAVKKSAKTPLLDDPDDILVGPPFGIYAFDRLNPDGIRICNFRGKDRPADILIKDRYDRIFALDEDLNLMWRYVSPKNTGHCPLPIDINHDGRDELLVGYTMLDADGRMLWTYPIEEDHTDEIVMGRFRGDGRGYFACVSGTQGFFIGDYEGHIIARDRIGHAQRVSVARYLPGDEHFQIAVSNFWGHSGVIYLYDSDGRELWEMENDSNGNILAPVNWDGDGTELILTNPDSARGGLLTGEGVRAVAFPEDGHPALCVEVQNLTGDDRDELIVWDYHTMYIYTQADGEKPQTYHPVKFPTYNASNYRGEYAYPDESFLKA